MTFSPNNVEMKGSRDVDSLMNNVLQVVFVKRHKHDQFSPLQYNSRNFDL